MMGEDGRVRFRVVAAEEGLTLRQVLRRRLAGLTAAGASELVRAGGVFVDNVRVRSPTLRVLAGERLTIHREAAQAQPLDPDALKIVLRDPERGEFLVVEKPAGVPVSAATAARGTLSAALVALLAREGLRRPYVGAVAAPPTEGAGLALFTCRDYDVRSFQGLYAATKRRALARLRVQGAAPAELRCEAPVLISSSGQVLGARPEQRGAIAAATRFTRLTAAAAGGSREGTLMRVEVEEGPALAAALVHAAALGLPASALPGEQGGVCLFVYSLSWVHPRSGAWIEVNAALPGWARAEGEGEGEGEGAEAEAEAEAAQASSSSS